ncbi:MAG: hypothetical protein VX444_14220 [Pseudomonadota bacterium]|nr:hypothetical protein [Pseudomonadota bacterium]
MSYPYIIWTMQRSGGTALADLLAGFSDHPTIQHEPFNAERRFGAITQAWSERFDGAKLERDLMGALRNRPAIKHCYELVPGAINSALITVARLLDYRCIVLVRECEVDRVLSLQLAKMTGAWGKDDAQTAYEAFVSGERRLGDINIAEAERHLRLCRERSDWLRDVTRRDPRSFLELSFAQVFLGGSKGPSTLEAVFEFLEIDPHVKDGWVEKVAQMRAQTGQNSARILPLVPNIDAARRALQAL